MTVAPVEAPFLSYLDFIATRIKEVPDLEIFGVPDASFNYRRYTLAQLDAYSNRLARVYAAGGAVPPRKSSDVGTKVISYLAPSSFEYAVNEMAMAKMGHCVMFLSVNNSVPALAHLIKTAKSNHLVYHPSLKANAEAAAAAVKEELGIDIVVAQQPSPEEWNTTKIGEPPFSRSRTTEEEVDEPAFIVHSSGSTGFPKPIFITHRASCHNFSCNFNVVGFTTLPLFHAHGHACFHRSIHCKKTLYMYPPELPLTTGSVVKALNNLPDVQGFYAVPYLLKLLAESEEGIKALQKLDLVTYGGAACPDELGDKLVLDYGVNLVGHYGSTETGQLMCSFRDFKTDKAWNYLRSEGSMAYGVSEYLRLEPQVGGLLKLVVMPGWPAKILTNLPDGGYTTNDLMMPHKTIPNAYKYVGRLDDTIMLVNGEKVNPVPAELAIKGSSVHVAEAVVFGTARAQVGVLILPTDLGKEQPPDKLFDLVWPVIETANLAAPSHGQILPEMVVILPYDSELPRTDKGSWIRPKTYAAFSRLIDATYDAFDAGESLIGGKRAAKRSLAEPELTAFVKELVEKTLGKGASLGVDEDLFTAGVDSLQAAKIRSVLQREIEFNGFKLPLNVVFEQPSIKRLSAYVLGAQTGNVDDAASVEKAQHELMKEYVAKYSQFGVNGHTNGHVSGDVVVLTGATGSLGAHLLDQLLALPSVSRVVCLLRAADDAQAVTRVESSLKQRGLRGLSERSDSDRVACWVAEPGSENLGLSAEKFAELKSSVTVIIHNAWAVNFTLGVESFETQHIRASYNLINLAITSGASVPARFYFSSSVSSVAAAPPPEVYEVTPRNVTDAQGMGYARSKWVVENMCANATLSTGIRAEVLRIGQMTGDSVKGIWNETEAISLMIKSAQTVGCLPDLADQISWLPVDLAAGIILDVMADESVTSTPLAKGSGRVWHIVNPSNITWADVHEGLRASGIKFDVVSPQEWVDRLAKSNPNPEKNPTIKLLGFFEGKYGKSAAAPSSARSSLVTKSTLDASATQRSLPPVQSLVPTFLLLATPLALDAPREAELRLVDAQEVGLHKSASSCWVVIDGIVYDITEFLDGHPAGAEAILPHAGKDVSPLFNLLHAKGTLEKVLGQLTVIGKLHPLTTIEVAKDGDDADEMDEKRANLPPTEFVFNLAEFERLAKDLLGEESRAWRYFSSFSDDGATYRATAESFSFLRFIPRINIPVKVIDSSTTFFGHTVPVPVFLAPTGQNRNGHPDGELNHVRAAVKTGIPQGVSGGSSVSIGEILEERDVLVKNGGQKTPVWWQLYIRSNRKESEEEIKAAVKNGANAILITVDVVALGNREADAKVVQSAGGTQGSAPPKKDGGIASKNFATYDANLSWDDIKWVQSLVPGTPVLVKGIGAVEDVVLAKQHGAAGVILSNHGARQLDHTPPPISTLVRLRKEHPTILEKNQDFEVYIDGGIRRGTDVVKALCLGAKGVGLGRAIIYAQTCYGEEGIIRALEIVTTEVQTAMRLLGARSVKELRPEMLELLPGLVGEQLK
ncbi:L-aminoadipate-semialdehyde dehydrogenase [Pseudohyphozyma bogoriensis]|nr:L-aminoadipate-semialdehyde dehydrogenase [Pseudohyphozyma bogoriensis]